MPDCAAPLAQPAVTPLGRAARGPFRPEVWLNARQRSGLRLATHYFRAIDVLAVIGLSLLTTAATRPDSLLRLSVDAVLPVIAGAAMLLALVRALRLYAFRKDMTTARHLGLVVASGGVALALALVLSLLVGAFALRDIVIWGAATTLGLGALHVVWTAIVGRWRRQGLLSPNIVIVGATRHAEALIQRALERRDINVLGVFDDRLARSPRNVTGVPVLGDAEALLTHRMTPFVDRIVLAIAAAPTPRIRDLFKKISTQLIHDGDMFGIVSTGPSSLAVDLTYDRKRLDEAIKRISGSGLKPQDILEQPGSNSSQGNQELRYRAHVAFSTAFDLMRELEKVQNRRKALIYVSNGYDFDPFPQGRLQREALYGFNSTGVDPRDPAAVTQRQGQQFADADLARELADLTRAANRANATVYTIDPRGLVGGAEMDDEVDMVEWNNHVRKTQDSLRVLAEETGGTAVVNQNDIEKALKKIDAETSDYYVLGYYSSNPDPTRKRRAIDVKVNRPGVSIWARKGYALKTPKDDEKTK